MSEDETRLEERIGPRSWQIKSIEVHSEITVSVECGWCCEIKEFNRPDEAYAEGYRLCEDQDGGEDIACLACQKKYS